jgi:hypothetical protein
VHDRMPVIVPAEHYPRWLDTAGTDVADLVVPWSGEPLRVYAVSTRVNAVRNDDAAICDPLDAAHGDATAADSAEPELPLVLDDGADDEEPMQASLF